MHERLSDMISALRVCPKCGSEIPADAPEGGCPGCLLESGLRLLDEEAVAVVREEEVAQDSTPGALEDVGRFGGYEIDRREDGNLFELGR